MFPLLKHHYEQVITENLQNKKKFEKSLKKEEGGDAKHVIFFIRPYSPFCKYVPVVSVLRISMLL